MPPALFASGAGIAGTLPDVEMLGAALREGWATDVDGSDEAEAFASSFGAPTRYFFASFEFGSTVFDDPSLKVTTVCFLPFVVTCFVALTVTLPAAPWPGAPEVGALVEAGALVGDAPWLDGAACELALGCEVLAAFDEAVDLAGEGFGVAVDGLAEGLAGVGFDDGLVVGSGAVVDGFEDGFVVGVELGFGVDTAPGTAVRGGVEVP